MNKSLALLSICLFFHFGQAEAQSSDLSDLSFKLGRWQWKTKGLLRPGDPKLYEGTGSSHVFYINDSSAIIDDHKILWEDGTDYKAITYRTYDSLSNTFLVVWAQANSTNSAKISGQWSEGKFVETEKGKDNYGNWVNRLEIYDIQADAHKAKLMRTYDSGYQIMLLAYEAVRIKE